MKENNDIASSNLETEDSEEQSSLNFQSIISLLMIYKQWFIISLIICLLGAFIYLRYAHPVYEVTSKILVKDQESTTRGRSSSMLSNMQDLGFISNSVGIDNEVEILQAHTLAEQAVKDLKLYVEYKQKGKVRSQLIYKENPLNIDLDPAHLDKMKMPIKLTISKNGNEYDVIGKTYNEDGDEFPFDCSFSSLPTTISTRSGVITITKNTAMVYTRNSNMNKDLIVTINPPMDVATAFVKAMNVEPTSKTTDIALITLHDADPDRASDYLRQLAVCYNRQANIDKNEVAEKTEAFINNRLEKINAELGSTEGALESYKKRNKLADLKRDATSTLTSTSTYEQKLADANTQVQLLNYLYEYISNPDNKMQVIPSNVGLVDQSSTALIMKYNEAVLERNRVLRSASENSPAVQTYTNTINELAGSIRSALSQARRGMEIQRQGIEKQYNMYNGKIESSPEQERILTQIGRQQEVKSGLYLMLLQKREENSISLAATADKGKLIDEPSFEGKVSPKSSIILLIALVLGVGIPMLFIYLIQLMRYKIEGHDDVARLTHLPIVADVAVASEEAKDSAGIVVHENTNNQIDEIFRSMRTNIQFMLNGDQKKILFTSSTSGEGKTFNAANLAVSFALLGKKVILMGLDIRKPALGRLFGLSDKQHGVTSLLVNDNLQKEDVYSQIQKSGVNDNLDLLLAGPIPPNPTELLARETLSKVIDALDEQYDYIITDTAPVGLVTDTSQIGKLADVTVYLCRADYTPKSNFAMLNSLVAEKKLKNTCIVLNGVDLSKKKYGYYYGYGKYGKYASYGGYGHRYGSYTYGSYGSYGSYGNSHDGNSIKK